MKLYVCIFISATLAGCLSSNDNKVDDYIRKIKCETKIEFPIDSTLSDSLVTVSYSLGLSNLEIGARHKVEVTFKSQDNKFIEGYSNDSYAEDSTANFRWSFFRKRKVQEGSGIQVILEINGIFMAKDTATYIDSNQNYGTRF